MIKKNKIAITFPHLHSFGGGEIFCEYISNYLSKYFDIDLYYYNTGKINNRLRINKRINLIPIKCSVFFLHLLFRRFIGFAQLYLIFYLNKCKNNYQFLFSAAGEFVSCKYDIFQYVHHPFFSLNPKHYLALGIKKTEIHKIIFRFILSIIGRFYFSLFYMNTIKKVKITLVNSKWTYNRYKSIYKEKKIFLVYPTFLIPNFFLGFEKKFEKRKDDFVILGRVERDKNTIEALKFFLDIKKNIKKVGRLHIIGPVNKINKKKIEKNFIKKRNDIIIHGYLKKNQRNLILKSCKYGLHFSKYEHFGRGILEMHKLGLIVFSHDSGGSNEISLSKFQNYKNFKDLKFKIFKVMSNYNLRKKLIQKYNKKFYKNFNDKIFRKKVKDIFLKKNI